VAAGVVDSLEGKGEELEMKPGEEKRMDLKLTDEEIYNLPAGDECADCHEANALCACCGRAIADAQLKKAVEEIDKVMKNSIREGTAFCPIWEAIKREAGIGGEVQL